MYKYLSLLFIMLFSLGLKSQSSTGNILPQSNSTKVILDSSGHDHFMFNITLDNVMDQGKDSFYNSNILNPNLGFYYMHDLPLGKSGVSIAPGLGLTFSKVSLDNSILYQDTMGTSFVQTKNHPWFSSSTDISYGSSSFYTSWLEVPIEVRYRSKPINGRSSFKAAFGFRAGIRLAANSKITYYDKKLGRDIDTKESPFSDLASFRYGFTFRVGYGAINLFGYYGMNQLIKDNKNYNNLDLHQYSIGISITGM